MSLSSGLAANGGRSPAVHAATHEPGGIDDLYLNFGHSNSGRFETMSRTQTTTNTLISGTVFLGMITAPASLTVANLIAVSSAATVYSGVVNGCRLGIYLVDNAQNISTFTLVAATDNAGLDNTIFALASTPYKKALKLAGDLATTQTSYALTQGTRYALAALVVTTGTLGSLVGIGGNGAFIAVNTYPPQMCNSFAGPIAPSAPTAALNGTGGSITAGAHSYKITYVTPTGESAASAASNSVTNDVNNTQNLLTIGTSVDTTVTARKIYRNTVASQGVWGLLATVAGNVLTTFNDTHADADVGATAAPAAAAQTDLPTLILNSSTGNSGRFMYMGVTT